MSRVLAAILTTLLIAACAHSQRHDDGADSRPALLRALDGHWIMTGDVRGKAVTYDMVAGPVLHASFTEMHMADVHVPSEYEARVFIGHDPEDQSLIVHWLDSFGGKYSIPHGTGQISGDTLQFTVAYPDGAFRDSLNYNPVDRTWKLAIEASQPDGSWKHFARYEIRGASTGR